MTAYAAAGEFLKQQIHQLPQRRSLSPCPRVCRTSPAIQTTFVTDTYRLSVEASGVRSDTVNRTGEVDCSVLADVVVIARAVESAAAVHRFQVIRGERTVFACGGTVNHNQINFSHSITLCQSSTASRLLLMLPGPGREFHRHCLPRHQDSHCHRDSHRHRRRGCPQFSSSWARRGRETRFFHQHG